MLQVKTAKWQETVALAAQEARRALVEVVAIGGECPALDPRVVHLDLPLPAGGVDEWSQATTEALAALL